MSKAERREARSDIRDELEEIDADMIGFKEELRDVRERIAAAKVQRAELKARLAELKTNATQEISQ
jgi:chromosome segregation ATPase